MNEPIRVVVVDYGAGNLVSIRNALRQLGADVSVAESPAQLEGAEVILVPGVGASEAAMGRLRRQGLVEPIVERVRAGTWFVGICLGLQLLFEESHEDGAQMLGLLKGDVEVIPDAPSLPHIGWNRLEDPTPPPGARGAGRRHPGVLRAQLRAGAGRLRRWWWPRPSTAAASPAWSHRTASSASSSTPSAPAPTGCACCATAWGSSRPIGRPPRR